MPYYPKSLEDLKKQIFSKMTSVPLEIIAIIARDCSSALKHIHSLGYAHCDVKPANIMLKNQENGSAVLVDFGAVRKMDCLADETTPRYCLDTPAEYATAQLDWTCLGSTLAELLQVDLTEFGTVEEVVDILEQSENPARDLVRACFSGNEAQIDLSIKKLCEDLDI